MKMSRCEWYMGANNGESGKSASTAVKCGPNLTFHDDAMTSQEGSRGAMEAVFAEIVNL